MGSSGASSATRVASSETCKLLTTLCTELKDPTFEVASSAIAECTGMEAVETGKRPNSGTPRFCTGALRLLKTAKTEFEEPFAGTSSSLAPASPTASTRSPDDCTDRTPDRIGGGVTTPSARDASSVDNVSIFGSECATPVSSGMAMTLKMAQQEIAATRLRRCDVLHTDEGSHTTCSSHALDDRGPLPESIEQGATALGPEM
jgi:hypothetical protein